MKRLIYIILALGFSLLNSSCTAAETSRTDAAKTIKISFTAQSPNTRAAFAAPEQDSYPVLWQEGDKVKILLNGSEVNTSSDRGVAQVIPSQESKSCSFTASISVPATLESVNFEVINPSSSFHSCSSGAVDLSIPATQTPSTLSADPAAMLLAAFAGPFGDVPSKVGLKFSHLCAYGLLSLTNMPGAADLRYVEISSEAPLSGLFSHPSGTLTLSPKAAEGKIRIVSSDPSALWFACAPSDWSGTSLTVTAVTSEGSYTRTVTIPSGREMKAGQVARFTVDMSSATKGKSSWFDESRIVFSFGAISDTHIDGVSTDAGNKFSAALTQLRDQAAKHDADGIDAFVVAGDLTDTPSRGAEQMASFKTIYEAVFDPASVPMIYTIGNHDVNPSYAWSSGTVAQAKTLSNVLGDKYFLTDLDNSARESLECRDCLVGGYHVLSITPNSSVPILYDAAAVNWLDARLKALTEAEPERFVFVNTHPMIDGTVYGSLLGTPTGTALSDIWYSRSGDYWATRALTPVLSKYPQAVTFGGHLHFPLHDPRSIFQGDFTSFGCGSTRYMAIENGKYENMQSATVMNDSYRVSDGWLIQIDADGNMRATAMDFTNRSPIGEPYEVSYPRADKTHLVPYGASRAVSNKAPEFVSEGLTVSSTKIGSVTSVSLGWDSALDDEFVHHYVLEVTNSSGTSVLSKKYLTDFYRHADVSQMQKQWTVQLGVLPAGDYLARLDAFDSWDAFCSSVKVFHVDAPASGSELYSDLSLSSGTLSDLKGKVSVSLRGASTEVQSLEYKGATRDVRVLQAGADKYALCEFSEISSADLMSAFASGGLSIETVFVDREPGKGSFSTHGVVCGTQAGGWGLAIKETGVPYFIVGEGATNSWKQVDAKSALSSSVLTHVVCVYDPSGKTVSIYINGTLSASSSVTGVFHPGAGDAFNRFCLGSDIYTGGVGTDYQCTNMAIAAARIYSGVLDAAAVKAAYDSSESLLTTN